MLYRLSSSVLVALLTCQLLTAAEPPAATEPVAPPLDLERINNPPKRDIQFERKAEPYKMQLFRADPRLLEQKVIAFVRCASPSEANVQAMDTTDLLGRAGTEGLRGKILFNSWALFGPYGMGFGGDYSGAAYFRRVIDGIPEAQRPAPNVAEFFLSQDADRDFIKGQPYRLLDPLSGKPSFAGFEFRILAPDYERAEALVAGLLQSLDWGVSRPVQLYLWEQRAALMASLPQQQGELEKLDKQLAEELARLDQTKDLNPEGLTDLRTQQWLLQVDVAGAKARVEACDRLLKGGNLGPRTDQVLDLKIAAEIELAGLSAKKGVLDELVTATRSRKDLELSHTSHLNDRANLVSHSDQLKSEIQRIDNSFVKFGPLPLADNKVVIQPIQWTQGE